MEYIDDNYALKTKATSYQVLVSACQRVRQSETDYTWIHGYCLLTCRIDVNTIKLVGKVDIGERYAENTEMVASLAAALDPAAVLVGRDLTDMVSDLGRLPTETDEPEPALALLTKLRTMLEGHKPVDLTITDQGRKILHAERLLVQFACPADQISRAPHPRNPNRIDSGNLAFLAERLADEAGACLLGFGQLKLTHAKQVALHAQWQNLRLNLVPSMPTMEAPTEPQL